MRLLIKKQGSILSVWITRPIIAAAMNSFVMELATYLREATGAIMFTSTFKAFDGAVDIMRCRASMNRRMGFRNRFYYVVEGRSTKMAFLSK